ncbi:MAG: hypothetical protein QM758_28665 [Armatimonas sp.]
MTFPFKTLSVATFATLSLIATGCGGGSGDTEEEGTITRTMLVGTGDSTTQTAKRWREVVIKFNSNYPGAGADQACPAEIEGLNGEIRNACNPLDSRELRSDGKWRSLFETAPPDPFISDWTLTGDTLVLVSRDLSDATGTFTYKLTDDGVVGGKQRIRMTLTSASVQNSNYPSMVGFQFVIEEV